MPTYVPHADGESIEMRQHCRAFDRLDERRVRSGARGHSIEQLARDVENNVHGNYTRRVFVFQQWLEKVRESELDDVDCIFSLIQSSR